MTVRSGLSWRFPHLEPTLTTGRVDLASETVPRLRLVETEEDAMTLLKVCAVLGTLSLLTMAVLQVYLVIATRSTLRRVQTTMRNVNRAVGQLNRLMVEFQGLAH